MCHIVGHDFKCEGCQAIRAGRTETKHECVKVKEGKKCQEGTRHSRDYTTFICQDCYMERAETDDNNYTWSNKPY
ncbi:hypothetical protein ACJ41O_000131 [Fusarium nematophilum]